MSNYDGSRKVIVVTCMVVLSTALLSACGQIASTSSTTSGGRQTVHSGASISRVQLYDSVASIADDSDLVITGKVSSTKVVRDVDDLTDFTILDVTVAQVLRGTLDVDHVTVRQTGSANQGSAERLLSEGSVVMLFLTSSGLPGNLATQYYVTGANAGVYTVSDDMSSAAWDALRPMSDGRSAATDAAFPSFERLNPDSGDTLPESLTGIEVTAAING